MQQPENQTSEAPREKRIGAAHYVSWKSMGSGGPGLRSWRELSAFERALIERQYPDRSENELQKCFWYLA